MTIWLSGTPTVARLTGVGEEAKRAGMRPPCELARGGADPSLATRLHCPLRDGAHRRERLGELLPVAELEELRDDGHSRRANASGHAQRV